MLFLDGTYSRLIVPKSKKTKDFRIGLVALEVGRWGAGAVVTQGTDGHDRLWISGGHNSE